MTIECQHGNLARVCELCEKDTEIMRLQSEETAVRIYLRERDSKDTEIMRLKSLLKQCKEALEHYELSGIYTLGESGFSNRFFASEALAAIEKEGL